MNKNILAKAFIDNEYYYPPDKSGGNSSNSYNSCNSKYRGNSCNSKNDTMKNELNLINYKQIEWVYAMSIDNLKFNYHMALACG